MTPHPRYQYKPEDLFQMDKNGFEGRVLRTGASGHSIRLYRRLAQTLPGHPAKDGLTSGLVGSGSATCPESELQRTPRTDETGFVGASGDYCSRR